MLMTPQRRPRLLAAAVLSMMVLPVAVVFEVSVTAVPAAAAPACDEGADHRHEYWRPVCTEPPEFGGGGGDGRQCALEPNLWGIDVTCHDERYGWWSHNWQCYLHPRVPPPGPGHPSWGGHDQSDGTVFRVTCPWLQGVDGESWQRHRFDRFVASGADTIGAAVAEAIGRLRITGPQIHSTPRPHGTGLVGLPVWLWTPVTEQTWSPPPLRVPVLGWVLVVDASVEQIEWDLGNGDTVVCDHPGTPYADHYGARPSPDCGYPGYRWPSTAQPDGVYQLSATTFWRVRWWFETAAGTPTGLSGVEQATRHSGPVPIRIHELQVVTS